MNGPFAATVLFEAFVLPLLLTLLVAAGVDVLALVAALDPAGVEVLALVAALVVAAVVVAALVATVGVDVLELLVGDDVTLLLVLLAAGVEVEMLEPLF